ncbi:MAG: twin-arginine translocase TatA/TatE family subunit [Muribaculaceae bacterium]|nr:twin-arginine translocase TatA/TatE family subunit [Muribaculaceae bacterium]
MNNLLLIGGLGMSEILVIALVVLLFFGGKKIPELMKGLGKGVRSFKEGMNEIEKEVKDSPSSDKKDCNAGQLGQTEFLGTS